MEKDKANIIVIESGTDASGKETQTNLLYERLKKENKKVVKFSFPNYQSKSSTFVKMYLNGDFGENPEDVSPYISSMFFAMDRYASYIKEIKKYVNEGYIIIIDRYTTSNMTYQASKIKGLTKRDEFLNWIYDFEFNMLGLPKPKIVIFLDLPVEKAADLIKLREKEEDNINKNNLKKDIHESDVEYLKNTYYVAKYVSSKYGWNEIKCLEDGSLKSREEISDEIYKIVKEKIKK